LNIQIAYCETDMSYLKQVLIENKNYKVDNCLSKTMRSAKIILNILLAQWIMFMKIIALIHKVIPAVTITVKM